MQKLKQKIKEVHTCLKVKAYTMKSEDATANVKGQLTFPRTVYK